MTAPALACCSWHHLQRGADAVDDVLSEVFGRRVPTTKDLRDPTDRRGFERVLRHVTTELLRVAEPHERDALRRCLHALDVNWAGLSPAERDSAIDRAAQALGGVPELVVTPVERVLSREGRSLVTDTKRATAGRHSLPVSASFNTVDQRVVEHAASSQAFYIRDEYGRRQDGLSAVARSVVARGLSDGLDRYDIGRDLRATMTAAGVARSESYWSMIASVFSARSRTWGTLASFSEAGIETYEIDEALDEVTCDVCRFMHGKQFSVGATRQRYEQVAVSDDPETVTRLQPFVSVGVNEDGERALVYGRGELLARVTESATGRKDETGTFSHALTGAKMQDAGISAPPYHPYCRGVVVPT